MGGWFRKEIKTPDDSQRPQDAYWRVCRTGDRKARRRAAATRRRRDLQALEKGTIDAAEWVGPYDDEKLGFNKVAQYYYYPAWWEGGPALHFFINTDKWASLPKSYQAIVEAAAAAANMDMLARYDAGNPEALKRLVAAGTQLRPFST